MSTQLCLDIDEPILKQAQTCPIPRLKIVDTLGKEKTEVRVDKNRLDRWKASGVIALSDYNLKAIPDEVWASGTSARVTELSNNSIRDVPAKIGCLNSLQVDVSSNLLSELGSLHNLKVPTQSTSLYLSNNGLRALCVIQNLTTLDLHNTEITVDVLRQFEGWEGFAERRRLKHQKQLDFRVVNSGAFDEGADNNISILLSKVEQENLHAFFLSISLRVFNVQI
ncbi:hypothetical protein DVH24_041679 [Malus domestica]|uniref:Uncharacterized protein n=1 Tax=Malus domestica TaxID=3750 RepID=A0A498IU11_MALDO|nr:hypothetical protein DVH24_041679 [Malus domestica]